MSRISDLSTRLAALGLMPEEIEPFGPGVAKISAAMTFRAEPAVARLVLVSSMSPTPAGNGKTTVSIGLTQAARRLGHRAVCALRQPSLGPIFGKKGGATGGGRSSLVPADRINLHFQLASRDRYERSFPAAHHHRARWQGDGRTARGRL